MADPATFPALNSVLRTSFLLRKAHSSVMEIIKIFCIVVVVVVVVVIIIITITIIIIVVVVVVVVIII